MKTLFGKYFALREESEGGESGGGEGPKKPQITSRIKLQKAEGSKEFGPFTPRDRRPFR